MALSSSVIGRKIGLLMNDLEAGYEYERTTIPEIATWILEACAECVRLKPTVLTERAALLLTPNSTRQKLSGTGIVSMSSGAAISGMTPLQLLDVGRNMGADGKTPGNVVIKIEQQAIDGMLPDWHTRDAEEQIRWAIIDPLERMAFQVCFQAPATAHYLEVLFSRLPVCGLLATATDFGTDDIDPGLSDELETAIVAYVAWRVLTKDSKSEANAVRGQQQLQAFAQALGVEVQKDRVYPKRSRTEQKGEA